MTISTNKALVIKNEYDLLKKQRMKRISNLYSQVYDLDNLRLADDRARKGKRKTYGVRLHDQNREENLKSLQDDLINKTFKTSEYTVFKIYKPKERNIYRLPYFPDRIVHHAVMNILEPIWIKLFTADTYSCIKGRGIHACQKKLIRDLRAHPEQTKYCLKLDIKKYYPSIDHDVIKQIIRRKIKDKDLLWLLDDIIESAEGLPIGNYLSQYLSNLYLTYFDHWLKEEIKVKYYYRYADDMVFLSDSKDDLRHLFGQIKHYLNEELNLSVKGDYQVFPVKDRGIDFIGYVFYHTHTLLRKKIKKNFAKAVFKNKSKSSLVSYMGWAKHCNSKHLLKKLNIQL